LEARILRVSRDLTAPNDKRYQVRQPVVEVALGGTFVVETINFRTPISRTAADANPAVYREREETGPIYVQGIEPGDVLDIEILDIKPEGQASGGCWDDPKTSSFLPIVRARARAAAAPDPGLRLARSAAVLRGHHREHPW